MGTVTVPPLQDGSALRVGGPLDPGSAPRPRARRPLPSARSARRSMTVDGVPGSSPPSSTRSAPARIASGPRRAARASGPPARFARSAGPASASPRARRPASAGRAGRASPGRARRRAGSGAAGWAAAAVTPPGSSRSSSARVRGAELGQRGERELELEEHHRRRLVGRPALERVQALDGLARVRARTPARRPCRRGTRRRRRPRCSARTSGVERCSISAAPTTTRSIPARSRDAPRSRRSRRARSELPRPRRPAPRRPRARAAPRGRGGAPATRRRIDVEPVGAARTAPARGSWRATSGAARVAVAPRTAGWRATASSRPGTPREQVALAAARRRARAARVGARDGERVRADVGRDHLQVGPLVLERQRDRARARADVDARARRRGSSSAASTSVLGLRPRDQHARVDRSSIVPEALARRGCRRPARARAPRRDRSWKRARRAGLEPAAGVGTISARGRRPARRRAAPRRPGAACRSRRR